MDKTVEGIIRESKEKLGKELNVLIMSDHGMVDTTKFIDLRTLTNDNKFGKDYLLFLDSTMIHIWYLNQERKDWIRGRIEDLRCGRFLSEIEREELKVNFNNRYYGDEVYLLEPGYSIFPNFMSWLKPYSMHAYHPDDKTQLGIVILDKVKLDWQTINIAQIVDLAPTILDTLGVDIPAHFKGKSILRH